MTFRRTVLFIVWCLVSVGARAFPTPATAPRAAKEPAWVIADGPGTVVSVKLLDLPFGATRYAVIFKTDSGQTIEVWHPGQPKRLVAGMHGMLLYTRNPEKVVDFRVIGAK